MATLLMLTLMVSLLCSNAYAKNPIQNISKSTTKVFTLLSDSFNHNGMIPAQYTCDGENISPELHWINPPPSTKSFALIVDDPDAPGKVWVHWIVFNIPATMQSLAAGVKQENTFIYGITDFYYMKHSGWQYGGPCPPSGKHHYHFTLYALDTMLNLPQDTEKDDLLNAMQGHIISKATLIGLYQRKK